MKAGNGEHFEQSYNAQAAVDTEGSMLVLGAYVTDAANDKQQLKPAVQSVAAEVREVTQVLADSGYFSESAVAAVEAPQAFFFHAFALKSGMDFAVVSCSV